MDLVSKAREAMKVSTKKHNAPTWELTEIAIAKGEELAKRYEVSKELVLTSLYLAHLVFSPVWKDEIQKNHPKLSSQRAKEYLTDWDVSAEKQEQIIDAIASHHKESQTKLAEVVKNAECFKFLTLKGALIFLHTLGKRGVSYEESVNRVIAKMEQKKKLLTLPLETEEERIRSVFG